MAGQMKLLRVLQSGQFERLGSSTTRKVDVRIVSATNADLPRAIAAGTFREDLYFRLNVIELCVPPLAERSDDILPLAEAFLRSFAGEGTEPAKLSAKAQDALLAYEWPGNVRELQNRIQRATLINKTGVIEAADLGLAASTRRELPRSEKTADEPAPAVELPEELAKERAQIEDALSRAKGVVSRAAAELGLSRQGLYRRMERLNIVLERRPR
jgi:DNA-binding NtrC family response regulator